MFNAHGLPGETVDFSVILLVYLLTIRYRVQSSTISINSVFLSQIDMVKL